MSDQNINKKFPTAGQVALPCPTCGQSFPKYGRKKYCSDHCWIAKAPAVYRFVCPDGRSYVGSRLNIKNRERDGIGPQIYGCGRRSRDIRRKLFVLKDRDRCEIPRRLERKRPLRFQRGGRLVSRPCERSENAYAVSR